MLAPDKHVNTDDQTRLIKWFIMLTACQLNVVIRNTHNQVKAVKRRGKCKPIHLFHECFHCRLLQPALTASRLLYVSASNVIMVHSAYIRLSTFSWRICRTSLWLYSHWMATSGWLGWSEQDMNGFCEWMASTVSPMWQADVVSSRWVLSVQLQTTLHQSAHNLKQ